MLTISGHQFSSAFRVIHVWLSIHESRSLKQARLLHRDDDLFLEEDRACYSLIDNLIIGFENHAVNPAQNRSVLLSVRYQCSFDPCLVKSRSQDIEHCCTSDALNGIG